MANLKRFENLEPSQDKAEANSDSPKLWHRKLEIEGEARVKPRAAPVGGLDEQIEAIENKSKYQKRKQHIDTILAKGTIEEQKAALKSQIEQGQRKFWTQILIVIGLTIVLMLALKYRGTDNPILRHIGLAGAILAAVSSIVSRRKIDKDK